MSIDGSVAPIEVWYYSWRRATTSHERVNNTRSLSEYREIRRNNLETYLLFIAQQCKGHRRRLQLYSGKAVTRGRADHFAVSVSGLLFLHIAGTGSYSLIVLL